MEFCRATKPIFAITLTESRLKNLGFHFVVFSYTESPVLVQFKIVCVPAVCYTITLADMSKLERM
jgi:hypothetical protein